MFLVMLALSLLVTALAYRLNLARDGLAESAKLLLQVGPVLIPAFVLAGMMSVLLPTETMTRFLGAEAGVRGLVSGTLAGAVTPGGPFLIFPLMAVLLKGGAGVGPVSAYLTSWALLGVHRSLVFEIPIMGMRFAALRWATSCMIPIAIGWLMQLLFSRGPS